MGSELNGRKKHHYDISKSRRTRRSSVATATPSDKHHTTDGSKMVEAAADKEVGKEEEEEDGRRSLKELMGGDGANNTSDVKEKNKGSCGEELKQDKITLAVVVRQGDGMEKSKMKGMVGRCMKVLNHLIKAKRDAHKGQKKANVRLLM